MCWHCFDPTKPWVLPNDFHSHCYILLHFFFIRLSASNAQHGSTSITGADYSNSYGENSIFFPPCCLSKERMVFPTWIGWWNYNHYHLFLLGKSVSRNFQMIWGWIYHQFLAPFGAVTSSCSAPKIPAIGRIRHHCWSRERWSKSTKCQLSSRW